MNRAQNQTEFKTIKPNFIGLYKYVNMYSKVNGFFYKLRVRIQRDKPCIVELRYFACLLTGYVEVITSSGVCIVYIYIYGKRSQKLL